MMSPNPNEPETAASTIRKTFAGVSVIALFYATSPAIGADLNVGFNTPNNSYSITSSNTYGNINVGSSPSGFNNQLFIGANGNVFLTNNGGGTGNLSLGLYGANNSLIITNGGQLTQYGYPVVHPFIAASATIGGNSTASNNQAVVTGTGSLWSLWGSLTIGNASSGNSMILSNGGTLLIASGITIGNQTSSSNNQLVITGSGSTISTNGIYSGITVGQSGSGNSLIVSNSASVTIGIPFGGLYLGQNAGSSNNSVIITGTNSSVVTTMLRVGGSGSGNNMVISNGASVVNQYNGNHAVIGWAVGSSNNSVTVTGTGSSLNISSNGNSSGPAFLDIGTQGNGALTTANKGLVNVDNGIFIGYRIGSSGTLNIGALGGSDQAGSITTPFIAFGSGTGTMNFNQTDTATVTSTISGLGTINQLGSGTTILTGANTYTGTTLITNGTFLAYNTKGSAVGTSSVLVTNAGTLGGSGTIGGPVTIASGGTLTPGYNGVGTLALTNGLTLKAGSTTSFLINSTNNYTSLSIQGGIVNYGGILRLDLTSYASVAAPGDTFYLFSTWGNGATNMNDFAGIQTINESMTFIDAAGIWTGTYNSLIYKFTSATGTLSVTQAAVPEPSTYALFGFGALALIVAYRRKVA